MSEAFFQLSCDLLGLSEIIIFQYFTNESDTFKFEVTKLFTKKFCDELHEL